MFNQKEIDEQKLINESDDFLTRYLSMYKACKENETNCEDIYLNYVKIAERRFLLKISYYDFILCFSKHFNQKPIERGIFVYFNVVLDPDLQIIFDWDNYINK